jgi:translation initiation factor 2 alpha subunit (eIF-2alpha)
MKLSKLVDPKFKTALTLLNSQKMPLKTAFRLKTIIQTVEGELEKYEQVRVAALNSYGNKNEDGSLAVDENGNALLSGDSAQAFVKELNDLLTTDVELPTISISELGNDLSLSSEELILLDFIVE